MKPEVLAKIESRWPHLATMCATFRSTGNVQVRNAIINAVLCAEVAYLTPSECFHLAALRASGTPSRAKAVAARENGKRGGRPKKKNAPDGSNLLDMTIAALPLPEEPTVKARTGRVVRPAPSTVSLGLPARQPMRSNPNRPPRLT